MSFTRALSAYRRFFYVGLSPESAHKSDIMRANLRKLNTFRYFTEREVKIR